MATIGHLSAVVDSFGMQFTGLIGYTMWAFIHVLYLVGWGNRIGTILNWTRAMTFTKNRPHRTITFERARYEVTEDAWHHRMAPRASHFWKENMKAVAVFPGSREVTGRRAGGSPAPAARPGDAADARHRHLRHRQGDLLLRVRHPAPRGRSPGDRPRVAGRGGPGRAGGRALPAGRPRGAVGAPPVFPPRLPGVPPRAPGLLLHRGLHRARHQGSPRLHGRAGRRARTLPESGAAGPAGDRRAGRAADDRGKGARADLLGDAAPPAVAGPGHAPRRARPGAVGAGARHRAGRAAGRDGARQRRLHDLRLLTRAAAQPAHRPGRRDRGRPTCPPRP